MKPTDSQPSLAGRGLEAAGAEPPSPFSPAALHLNADYAAGLGVRRAVLQIPCRRPGSSEWFRVRPGAEWRLQTNVLEESVGFRNDTYLVSQELWAELGAEVVPALLLTCINRTGDVFLWRVKLPRSDGRLNAWSESAIGIAQEAEKKWCRLVTGRGRYEHFVAEASLPEPAWPSMTFEDVLNVTFRDKYIGALDHYVVRQRRGAV